MNFFINRITRAVTLGSLIVTTSMVAPTARGLITDSNFTDTGFVNDNVNLNQMTGIGWAPDGSNRLFAIRKTGQVMIIQNGALVVTPFATLSPVFTNSECGLIGFTFDPGFASNGYIYFFVTVSASEQRILRYTASGNTGTSPMIIKSGLPTLGNNHDGGGIGIGPDGKLYWAVGDQGNRTGVDLNLTTLAAKIGRANRDGSLPQDNPFNDGAGPNDDFIWSRGVRNPFTLTFQPGSGKLWVNVVGDSYEQVFVATRGSHAGYDDFENNQPTGYLTPVIKYRTNGTDNRTVAPTGATRSGNIVTFTTTTAHRFRMGEKITIAGVTDASFNGSFYVASAPVAPTATTFTVAQIGPNGSSGGGSATTQNQGGSLSGGTFWDSTAAPAAYRGNFFYGDYNSGRMMRATLDGADQVTSVDYFSSNGHLANYIDTAIGPDGAIYYASVGNGQIRRASFSSSGQNLIVTPTLLQTDEGARIAFSVRLAIAPVANVSVTVGRTSGDTDLNVFSGASLTFTPANFATPQAVMLEASQDADATNDQAVFTVASAGLTSQTVNLTAVEDDLPSLVPSVNVLAITEGATGQFTVRLSDAPAANTTVTVARTSGDTDVSVSGGASLVFTPLNFATPQPVTIAAAEDADFVADSAVISVQATGFGTQTVSVSVSDNDQVAPAFTSTPDTQAVVNAPYSYQAVATGQPAPAFSLTTFPTGMVIDSITGVITWTPNALGNFAVTIVASNGAAPNATQSFSIAVVADQPPVAIVTKPYPGEIVSGNNAEWFGDGVDDVGCTQAQFFVDNVLASTDVNSGNHYHFGGAHLLWDTTLLTNGAHTLRMTVTDTAGQTGSSEFTVIVGNGITPLEAWRLAKFTAAERLDPSISGNEADPEFDGFTNLMEYALGLEPKLHAPPAHLPGVYIERVSGVDYLALRYRRPINGRPGLAYNVQVGGNLLAWTSGPAATTGVSILPNGDGTETVSVRDNLAIGDQSQRYIRLQVPPP